LDAELDFLKIVSSGLAGTAVLDNFKADLLAFDQAAHACALDSGDVHEHVRSAIFRLNKAKAFGGVEEFYGSYWHNDFLSIGHGSLRASRYVGQRG
jgi:hypothetical protein